MDCGSLLRERCQTQRWASYKTYEHIVLDMDGCLWIGDELTARAGDAVAALRAAGKGLAFVTNNPRRSAEDYVAKMWRLGIQASPSDVVTVGGATQHLLAETRQGRTAFVIGSPALHKLIRAKFAIARAPSPTREARALPRLLQPVICG